MFANVDDQLDVPVRPDAEQTIVAGARRLRRRRLAAVTATGAAAVVAVVAIGVALALPNQEAMPPADLPTTTTTTTTTEPSVSETVPTPPTDTAPPAAPPMEGDSPTTGPNPPGNAPAPTEPVSGDQLGPNGFGALRLGMDVESAMATGMVGDGAAPGTGCVSRPLLVDGQASGEVYFGDKGLQIIAPGVPVHTVDGVSVGWTTAEFVARYPDEQGAAENGTAYLAVPGNADATYRVVFADDRVSRIQLRMADQICG